MKFSITLILLFIAISISAAQSKDSTDIGKEGVIFFKDGTTKKGFIKIEENDIWYKTHEKDSTETFYNFNSVERFHTITSKGSLRGYHYELIPDGYKTKVVLVDDLENIGVLYFKNKTEKKGHITIKKNKIIFKEKENSKETLYNFNSVYKLILHNKKGDIDDYEYRLVSTEHNNKTEARLLRVKLRGKVSLLCTSIISRASGSGLPMPMYGVNSSGEVAVTNTFSFGSGGGPVEPNELFTYYLSSENDMYAIKAPKANLHSSRFRKKIAPQFFSDCPELMKKIKNKVFEKDDFEGVVNFYNNECVN